jgi:hypothetical protein
MLPDDLRSLLVEVYIALSSESPRLALMGVRTMVDIVALHKVGDVGGFAQKMKALREAGVIAVQQEKLLSAVLEAGHAAAHRGHVPSAKLLNSAMDITENLLQVVYVLDEAAEELRKSTPRREKNVGGDK